MLPLMQLQMDTIGGAREHTVEARGLRFHYLEWGAASSPPMVLLHGLTGHARTWDHMGPALAERYHVLVPDQRGHGDTSFAETYRTEDFVADVEALVEHWGLDRFILVGLSMGGHNAMAYTAAHPHRVSHLCVIDIAPQFDRRNAPNWDAISKLAVTGHTPYHTLDEAIAAARAGNPTAPDEKLRYRTAHNLIEQPDGTLLTKYDPRAPARWEPTDLWPHIANISVPVLLVRGGLTRVLARAEAERMQRTFPDAELVEVADSGHSVPTDRPEKLAPILLDWLDRRR